MLTMNREQGSGDDAVIWQRANGITGKWASAVNPSTGKSYVYKQPDTGSDWHITSMPKLEDVRGQIVLVTPDVKSYNYGMCLDTLNGWSVHGNVAGVSMAFENHYEVDRATKADYVQAFYGGDSTENVEEVIISVVSEMIKEADIKKKDIHAIAAGAPGVIDQDAGIILFSPNLPWRDYDIASPIRDKFEAPFYIGNDVNVGVLGEYKHGAAQGYHNVAGFFVGTGMGGGLILDDKLYTGNTVWAAA